jgi:hypothetical protein
MATNQQIVLAALPQGRLTADAFQLLESPMPAPGAGEVLTRTRLLSIDAANRAWMQGATYRGALGAGQVMDGFTLAEVVKSNDPGFAPGDIVEADNGWQQFAVHPAGRLTRVTVRGELSHHLSVLGVTGLTAYFGLLDIGRPEPGETVLVSAAAGATGNVVGQIAKLHGCRVVGVASSADKCAFLTEQLGFDAAVPHRDENFRGLLKAATPDGVDVYFDNVGGDVLGAALWRMNQHGRIVCCGVVSQYDTSDPAPGPRGVPGLLVTKRLRMEGFIVMDHFGPDGAARAKAEETLAGWVAAGQLRVVEDGVDGLERAPAALIDLLAGGNLGKRFVRVT